MLVRFGGGIVDARGSVAGTTASRNSAGPHLKSRITGIHPNSVKQSFAKSRVNQLNNHWRTQLSDADRLSWSGFSATMPQTNKIGNTIILSGAQMFMKLNNALATRGFAPSSTPPITFIVDTVLTLSVVADLSVAHSILVTQTQTTLAGLSLPVIFASPPISSGRSFIGSQLRECGSITPNGTTDITANWIKNFGTLPTAGSQKIFIRCFLMNLGTGLTSANVQANCLTT